MTTITLKNIPEKLYADLKEAAKNNQRSLNGEILFAIQSHLMQTRERPGAEEVISRAREFRAKVKGAMLTHEEIEHAINEGHP